MSGLFGLSGLVGLGVFLSGVRDVGAQEPTPSVADRLERLAAVATHFATDDIIRNRWSDGRWPSALREQQEQLLRELRGVSGQRDLLASLLGHRDPRVRTLALGALFAREDPRDLPLIAARVGDRASTFTLVRASPDSRAGPLPLASFESTQTVGDVAEQMIRFYLDAAFESGTFEQYWAARGARARSASWLLVKLRRATRQTTPLQPAYAADIARVIAEIDALPPSERPWTLLYLRAADSELPPPLGDSLIVASLAAAGPDALMALLRREVVTGDPDLRPAADNSPRAHIISGMIVFVLAHAPELLRASDAAAVLAGAEADRFHAGPIPWIAAAARLEGLDSPEQGARSLRDAIQRIPLGTPPGATTIGLRGAEGQTDQAMLAIALWQLRGAAELPFLTNWFYTALPLAREHLAHGPESFLRSVDAMSRPDTRALLSAIVGDARFDQTDWASLAQILEMVNRSVPTPLVESRVIYDYQPRSERPDQREALAAWRARLRRHFGR